MTGIASKVRSRRAITRAAKHLCVVRRSVRLTSLLYRTSTSCWVHLALSQPPVLPTDPHQQATTRSSTLTENPSRLPRPSISRFRVQASAMLAPRDLQGTRPEPEVVDAADVMRSSLAPSRVCCNAFQAPAAIVLFGCTLTFCLSSLDDSLTYSMRSLP